MTGSEAVDRIISVRSLVLRAEAGKTPWSRLISMVDTAKELDRGEAPYEFVGDMYVAFRIIEAAASWYRDKHVPVKKVVREMVAWAREQRAAIEQQLENNASFVPMSSYEEYGKGRIEMDLRWALQLLDELFPAWGY